MYEFVGLLSINTYPKKDKRGNENNREELKKKVGHKFRQGLTSTTHVYGKEGKLTCACFKTLEEILRGKDGGKKDWGPRHMRTEVPSTGQKKGGGRRKGENVWVKWGARRKVLRGKGGRGGQEALNGGGKV